MSRDKKLCAQNTAECEETKFTDMCRIYFTIRITCLTLFLSSSNQVQIFDFVLASKERE